MNIMNILDLTQKIGEKIDETAEQLREDEIEEAIDAIESAKAELEELERCMCELATYTETDAKKGEIEKIIRRFIIP